MGKVTTILHLVKYLRVLGQMGLWIAFDITIISTFICLLFLLLRLFYCTLVIIIKVQKKEKDKLCCILTNNTIWY